MGERSVQAGAIGRLDLLPFNDKRVLALTSALTRSTNRGGTCAGYLTGNLGTELTEDVGLLQLESTRVLRERVLWTSLLSTSLTSTALSRAVAAPTIIAADTSSGGALVTGGAPPQPGTGILAAEARSSATWYSAGNRARYVAQLQARLERGRVGGQAPHSTFTAASLDALRAGEAITLTRENG